MSSTLEEKKPSKSELELEWLAPVTDHIAYIVRIPANPDYCDENDPFLQVCLGANVLGTMSVTKTGKIKWRMPLLTTCVGAESKIEEIVHKNLAEIRKAYEYNRSLAG